MTDLIVPSMTGNVTGLLGEHFNCCGVLGLVRRASSSSTHYRYLFGDGFLINYSDTDIR